MVGMPYFLQVIWHFLKKYSFSVRWDIVLPALLAIGLTMAFVLWAENLPECSDSVTTSCQQA